MFVGLGISLKGTQNFIIRIGLRGLVGQLGKRLRCEEVGGFFELVGA